MTLLAWLREHQHTLVAAATTALDVAAVSAALARRRSFSSTLAWLLAILALPLGGAIAYFLLADPRVHRARKGKRAALARLRQLRAQAPRDSRNSARASLPLYSLGAKLTGLAPTDGNDLELLIDNRRTFELLEGAIAGAKKAVWAEYYIIEDDRTGRRFLERLIERARAGVEVRLLYDAVGAASINGELLAELERAGGKTAAFLPVNPLRRRWAVHLRNHRKLLVVDGTHGFMGGMNVGDVYSGVRTRKTGRKRKPIAWRDTHLSIRGPAVSDLAEVFAEDWLFATYELLDVPQPTHLRGGKASVSIVPSGPDQELNAIGLAYFTAIATARSRCYITSPYFVPDEATLRAIESAAYRGVDVRVLVPWKNDVPLMSLAIRSYYPRLLEAGVRIFEYRAAMLHAKTMVVDGEASIIGSANIDMRSFRLNFEVSALVFDETFARALEGEFLADLDKSSEVSRGALLARPAYVTQLEGAAQLLSPLL